MSESVFKTVYICSKCNHEMTQLKSRCDNCNAKREQSNTLAGGILLILTFLLFAAEQYLLGFIAFIFTLVIFLNPKANIKQVTVRTSQGQAALPTGQPTYDKPRVIQPKREITFSAYDGLIENIKKILSVPITALHARVAKNAEQRKEVEARISELSSKLAEEELFEANVENLGQLKTYQFQLKRMITELNALSAELKTINLDYDILKTSIPLVTTQATEFEDNVQKLDDDVQQLDEAELDELSGRLSASFKQIQGGIDSITSELPDVKIVTDARYPDKIVAEIQKPSTLSRTTDGVRSYVTETIISNFMAFIAIILLIISGVLLSVYLVDNFSSNASEAKAQEGVLYLAITSGLLLILALLTHPKTISKYNIPLASSFGKSAGVVYDLFVSFGIFIAGITIYAFTLYFKNLSSYDTPENFVIYGSLLFALGSVLSYLLRSPILSLSSTLFGMMLVYVSTFEERIYTTSFISSDQWDIYSTLAFLVVFSVTIVFILRKKLWLPLVGFSLFGPIIAVQGHEQLIVPEYLLLLISVSNILLVLGKKFPTPKPFSHFLGTVFLIYPNSAAIALIVMAKDRFDTSLGSTNLVIVFSLFFILYWVFVLYEEELNLSLRFFELDDKSEALVPIQKKLNWMMLASLVVIFVAWFSLLSIGIEKPLMPLAVLLSLCAFFGMKVGLNDFVKSSVFLMIIEAEIFFIFSLETANALMAGLFLLSFTFILEMIVRKWPTLNVHLAEIKPEKTYLLVAAFSIINFLLPMRFFSDQELNDYGGALMLLLAISWLSVSFAFLIKEDISPKQSGIRQIALIAGLFTLFMSGIVRDDWGFGWVVEDGWNNFSDWNHYAFNITIFLFQIFAFVAVFQGHKLIFADDDKDVFPFRSLQKAYPKLIADNRLYLPQIIMYILPAIYFSLGYPYFYHGLERQALLYILLMIVSFSLPALLWISRKKKNYVFEKGASFTGYYSVIAGFIFLGGMKTFYDAVLKASGGLPDAITPTASSGGKHLFPMQWGIFIVIVLFTLSFMLTVWITRNDPIKKRVVEKKQEKNDEELKEENS
ncbi:MAG: hypothetical protein KAR35_02415 [Candidatus Heimdallarchaeota archaeon]|nr:hypothetical protein [Candidatus Heimdallarchaeota archaeon]MCK5048208.1 hypothetical protein [Candidatus Heimdallarchaeota archaeon]